MIRKTVLQGNSPPRVDLNYLPTECVEKATSLRRQHMSQEISCHSDNDRTPPYQMFSMGSPSMKNHMVWNTNDNRPLEGEGTH